MDIIGGLTAAKLALDLAKDLREIDKSIDEATYRMKLAELMSALADTQIAFADAKTRIGELEVELNELKNGAPCPKCRSGTLKLNRVGKASTSAVEFHHCVCSSGKCDYETTRLFDASLGVYSSNLNRSS